MYLTITNNLSNFFVFEMRSRGRSLIYLLLKYMNLSLEQKALIPMFTEKWLNIAFSEQNIDRDRAKKIIIAAYSWFGYSEPKILFFKNIDSIASNIQPLLEEKIANLNYEAKEPIFLKIGNKLEKPLAYSFQTLYRKLCVEVSHEYFAILRNTFGLDLYEKEKYFYQIYDYTTHNCSKLIKQNLYFSNYELKFVSAEKLKRKLEEKFFSAIFPNTFYTCDCLFIDYCCEVLNCSCDVTLWNLLKQLCADCGLMLIPFQSICLVCDRHKLPARK